MADNFTYPRYDLDFALFRVYEHDAPIRSEHFLKWNTAGAGENELVFVSGHPGSTDRDDTVAELETARDVDLPTSIAVLQRRLKALRTYAAGGAEQARQAAELIFGLENGLKADTYDAQRFAQIRGASFAGLGLSIVQYVAEVQKPDGQRLSGFHAAQIESTKRALLSPAPVDLSLQRALLADALRESLEKLGPAHPFIKASLDGRSPEDAAAFLIDGTKLADPAVRQQLLDGGEAAIAASSDPLIVLGRKLAPMARALRETIERDVTGVEEAAHEKIGQARFAAFGSTAYPDATFTLRLSYGAVRGYPMNGTMAPYKTTFAGLSDRSAGFDGKEPFALAPRFVTGRGRLDLSTPLDFVTTNDIIGGNSGSPVVNRAGEIVGLIFDGNIESLAGRYVCEEAKNRSVAVHSGAITHALRTIYDAAPLADEIDPKR
jgi:hypothetical protein